MTGSIRNTHGRAGTRTYNIWCGMKRRCEDARDSNYHKYGGRGISVCGDWSASFEAFVSDMGEAPDGMSLDRFPDGNGNYEPGNCRWATALQQARNTRRNRHLTINGETKILSEWAKIAGVSAQVFAKRLERGWSPGEALSGREPHLATGDRNGSTKLADADVAELRSCIAGGMSQRKTAEKCGISQTQVRNIAKGKHRRTP